MRTSTRVLTALTSASLLLLTACGGGTAGSSDASASTAAATVTVEDAWVKAADSGMSAAFGTLKNSSGSDVTVVSAATKASKTLQLHETVDSESGEKVMREKEGGFTIGAGKSLELMPGGSHIMLMDLTKPLKAGEEVEFTLTLANHSTVTFTAPVKDYEGANENYQSGEHTHGMDMSHDSTHSGHDMDHSAHDTTQSSRDMTDSGHGK